MKKINVFEGFAGYGGASFALKQLQKKYPNFKYDIVGYSEIDKFASQLYDANHFNKAGETIKNFGDITKIDPTDKQFPKFDFFTGGFPCQPFSTAGMQKGEKDPYGRGTMFQEIARICSFIKPKYILLENVKGFLSKKFESTRNQIIDIMRECGYVSDKNDKNETPLHFAVLNTKDYGIPQNRERVWMFAKLGGLPKDFSMTPPKQNNGLFLKDFLDPKELIPSELYLTKDQIEHLKQKHQIKSFKVKTPLCFDVYNKKIKYDGYCITITMPEHNSFRLIEPNPKKEVVRKFTVPEQFRLMGLEGLLKSTKFPKINFAGQSYSQLSKRAGNGWDVNLVTILLEHIFKQLKVI